MKILFVIGAFLFGGAERVICNLANWFALNGDEVTLLAVNETEEMCYTVEKNVHVINGIGRRNQIDAIWKLRKIIKVIDPQVVVSFLTHINIAVIISLFGTGIPVIVSERNAPSMMPPEWYRKMLRAIVYPFAKGVVFQTEQAQEYFGKIIRNKSVIIPNPILLSMDHVDLNYRKKVIVTVARLVPQKNQEMLIKAFACVSSKHKEYVLHIYGDGDLKDKLSALISELGMEDRIILKGETKQIQEEIRSAEIFALTSKFEGMPNALMEAMGLGLACISTDCPCGGPAFLIRNMQNGILVPVDDVNSLVDALNSLLENTYLRESISLEAQKIYQELKPETIYEKWRIFLLRNIKGVVND